MANEKNLDHTIRQRLDCDTRISGKLLAAAGRLLYPAMLSIGKSKVQKDYELYVTGRDRIPEGPAIFATHHQDRDDAITNFIAIGEPTSVVIAADSDARWWEWAQTQMMGAIPVMRGATDQAKENQSVVQHKIVNRLVNDGKVMIAPEATFSPIFREPLLMYKGIIDAAMAASREYGRTVPIVPEVNVYTPDEEWQIEQCHVEFMEPFDYNNQIYRGDSIAAVNGLRQCMLEKRLEMADKYARGMTQADYKKFREARLARFPFCRDYKETYMYSLNYRLAKSDEERAAVEALFRDN